MAQTMTGGGTTVRSFKVSIPDLELSDLRSRINATKWPDRETVTDTSQGVQLATLQALTRYRSSRPRSTGSTSTSST